jgi:hypothetical protein
MACGSGKIYINGSFPTVNDGTELSFISEAYMDTYPDLLIGMDCAAARQYLIDNQAAVFSRVVKDGTSFPRPDETNASITGEGAGYQVYIQPIGGVYDLYGTWSISPVDGIIDEITWPGPWPMIIGVDVAQIYFNRVVSSGNPDDGFKLDAESTNLASFDFNSWWCCAAAARGCTEGCGGGALYGGRFLIPPTDPPAPGEENATTPVLNQAIYLSNYTFQFTNNFGRVK